MPEKGKSHSTLFPPSKEDSLFIWLGRTPYPNEMTWCSSLLLNTVSEQGGNSIPQTVVSLLIGSFDYPSCSSRSKGFPCLEPVPYESDETKRQGEG